MQPTFQSAKRGEGQSGVGGHSHIPPDSCSLPSSHSVVRVFIPTNPNTSQQYSAVEILSFEPGFYIICPSVFLFLLFTVIHDHYAGKSSFQLKTVGTTRGSDAILFPHCHSCWQLLFLIFTPTEPPTNNEKSSKGSQRKVPRLKIKEDPLKCCQIKQEQMKKSLLFKKKQSQCWVDLPPKDIIF